MVYSSFRVAVVPCISLFILGAHGAVVRKDDSTRQASAVQIGSHGELAGSVEGRHELVPNIASTTGVPEPVTFVITCGMAQNQTRFIDRVRARKATEGVNFELFPCVQPTRDLVKTAIDERLLGFRAEQGLLTASEKLGIALTHLRLWEQVAHRGISANILEEGEIVRKGYLSSRTAVLAELPADTEFVNFNPMWPDGDAFQQGTITKDRLVKAGLPKFQWLSNYYITTDGARRLLRIMRGFDLGPRRNLDFHVRLGMSLTSTGCKDFCHVNGVLLTTNSMSVHCSDLHIPGVKSALEEAEAKAVQNLQNSTEAFCKNVMSADYKEGKEEQ